MILYQVIDIPDCSSIRQSKRIFSKRNPKERSDKIQLQKALTKNINKIDLPQNHWIRKDLKPLEDLWQTIAVSKDPYL